MMYFLDFDRTLFDTDAFIEHLKGRPDTGAVYSEAEDQFSVRLGELSEKGQLSFAPGELTRFLYADTSEFMRMMGNEAVIVTYGNPTFQKLKVENACAGIPRISAHYTGAVRKGEYMKERMIGYGASCVFADDNVIELANMAEHCPNVRMYEMRRDGKEGDGRWPVIRSLAELP